jgi:hypothetical protein
LNLSLLEGYIQRVLNCLDATADTSVKEWFSKVSFLVNLRPSSERSRQATQFLYKAQLLIPNELGVTSI